MDSNHLLTLTRGGFNRHKLSGHLESNLEIESSISGETVQCIPLNTCWSFLRYEDLERVVGNDPNYFSLED